MLVKDDLFHVSQDTLGSCQPTLSFLNFIQESCKARTIRFCICPRKAYRRFRHDVPIIEDECRKWQQRVADDGAKQHERAKMYLKFCSRKYLGVATMEIMLLTLLRVHIS